jgi:hypothetical protein
MIVMVEPISESPLQSGSKKVLCVNCGQFSATAVGSHLWDEGTVQNDGYHYKMRDRRYKCGNCQHGWIVTSRVIERIESIRPSGPTRRRRDSDSSQLG